ncbi:hypothetical protein K438DRAFT_2018273 [Mycena galopus ATCC 62051]|nr:hypothetical protein K438DRAFT_2018273 [Mycena galopus ATCC 62051]
MPSQFFAGSSNFSINGGNFQEMNGKHIVNNFIVSAASPALDNAARKKVPADRDPQMGRTGGPKNDGNKKGKETAAGRRDQTKAAHESEDHPKALRPFPRSSSDPTGKTRPKPARTVGPASAQRSIAPGGGNTASSVGVTDQVRSQAGAKHTPKRSQSQRG